MFGSGVTLGGFIQLHHESQWYLSVETKDFLPTIAKFIQQTLFLSAWHRSWSWEYKDYIPQAVDKRSPESLASHRGKEKPLLGREFVPGGCREAEMLLSPKGNPCCRFKNHIHLQEMAAVWHFYPILVHQNFYLVFLLLFDIFTYSGA